MWDTILADLGTPTAARIGKALGVGASTVYRWNAAGEAPKVACLALFWLTRWGRSAVHSQAHNDAMVAVGLARSLGEERDRLRRTVAALDAECEQLAGELRQQLSRGSAAIGHQTRTDTGRAGSSADAALPWPALVLDGLLAWPSLPGDRRDSPEARPLEARSGKSLGAQRRPAPQPSGSPEDGLSSPLVADRCLGDAILPPRQGGSDDLFYMGQAPASAPPATPAGASSPAPVASSTAQPGRRPVCLDGADGHLQTTTSGARVRRVAASTAALPRPAASSPGLAAPAPP